MRNEMADPFTFLKRLFSELPRVPIAIEDQIPPQRSYLRCPNLTYLCSVLNGQLKYNSKLNWVKEIKIGMIVTFPYSLNLWINLALLYV